MTQPAADDGVHRAGGGGVAALGIMFANGAGLLAAVAGAAGEGG